MGLLNSFKKAYNKHGGAWFAVGAITLTVVEGITAYRAGKRSGQHPEWDTKQKVLNVAAPVAVGAADVACIAAGQHKNAGQIATLVSSQILNEKKRQQWMKKATEVVGEENMNKIRESMHPVNENDIRNYGDDIFLFIDDYTGAKTYSTIDDMRIAIDMFHEYYHREQCAAYGTWLEFAGFERFDGINNPVPVTCDIDGNAIAGLSDMKIGFNACRQWEDYNTDWIGIYIREHVNKETGQKYFTVDMDAYPMAKYDEY